MTLDDHLNGKGNREEEPTSYEERIRELVQKGKDDEAISLGKAAFREGYANAMTASITGALLNKKGRTEEALDMFRRMPNAALDTIVYNEWSRTLLKANRSNEAITILERAVMRNQTDATTYENLISAYSEQGKKELAMNTLHKAWSEQKTSPQIYTLLVETSLHKGNFLRAKYYFDEARPKGQAEARQFLSIATHYMDSGNPEEADNIIKEGLATDPTAEMYSKAALNLFNLKKSEEVVNILKEAKEKNCFEKPQHVFLGFAYNDLEKKEESIEHLQESLKAGFRDKEIYEMLLRNQILTGRTEEIVKPSMEAERLGLLDMKMKLALAKYTNHPKKKDYLEEALMKDAIDAEAVKELAYIYKEDGEHKKIQEAIGKAYGFRIPVKWLLGEKLGDQLKAIKDTETQGVQSKLSREHLAINSLKQRGEYETILKMAERLKKDASQEMEAFLDESIVEAYDGLEQEDKAINFMENLKSEGRLTETLTNLLSWHYVEHGQKKKAAALLEETVSKGDATPETYYQLAKITKEKKHTKALEDIAAEEEGKHNALLYLSSLAEDGITEKTRTEYLRRLVEKLKEAGDIKEHLKIYKRASHDINIIKDTCITPRTAIIKEGDSSFEQEKMYLERLREALKDEDAPVSFPEAIDTFSIGDKHYYVMSHEKGASLSTIITARPSDEEVEEMMEAYRWMDIKNQDLEVMTVFALKVMSSIYRKMPGEELSDYDFKNKLLDSGYSHESMLAAADLTKALVISPYKSFYTDGWSDNHHTAGGKIIKLDTEARGRAPFAMDIAQTLNYLPHMPFRDTLNYMDWVTHNVNQPGNLNTPIEDKSRLRFEYILASLFRTMLNSRKRGERDHPIDAYSLTNTGIEIVDLLKEIYTDDGSEWYESIKVMEETFKDEREKWRKEGGNTLKRINESFGSPRQERKYAREMYANLFESIRKEYS